MSERLSVSLVPEVDMAIIRISGSMDLGLFEPLREVALKYQDRPGMLFLFDFTHATRLHDSGIALLISFQQWLEGTYARIRCTNCGPHIMASFQRTNTQERFRLLPVGTDQAA